MPDEVTFRTKPEIALDQIRAALEAGAPPGVVLMDAGYGADTRLRSALAELGLAYVASVQPHTSVWTRANPSPAVRPWSGRGRARDAWSATATTTVGYVIAGRAR